MGKTQNRNPGFASFGDVIGKEGEFVWNAPAVRQRQARPPDAGNV